MKARLFILGVVLLSGCSALVPGQTGTTVSSQASAATPSPSAWSRTSTVIPTITILPGLSPLQHAGFPGIVFLVDLQRWADDTRTNGSIEGQEQFLQYKSIPDCRLKAYSAGELPTPARISVRVMRGRVFHVYEYPDYALYESNQVFFKLEGNTNHECLIPLETILANLADESVYDARVLSTLVVTKTPVALGNFSCESLSPRLQPGELAYIGTSGVWLRETPSRSPDVPAKLIPREAPVLITIEAGPQCADEHVYWRVSVNRIGVENEAATGWMAEANTQRYLLFNWNP